MVNIATIDVLRCSQGQDETQKTDVHYRLMDDEGNFN